MTNDDKLDVYISCSKKDLAIVERIGAKLRENQVNYWYSLRSPITTNKQIQAIDEAIEKCQVVISVFSSNYSQDTFFIGDIRKAHNKDKPIILFSLDDIDFPRDTIYRWGTQAKKNLSVIPIDVWKGSFDKSIELLLQTIFVYLERTEKQVKFNEALDLGYYNKRQTDTDLKSQKRDLKVFLCHSSGDKSVVENFYDLLVKDGINAWLDKKSLIPGQNWQIEIPKVVRNSDVVIVFLSSQSVTKEGFVQKEIKIALDTADEKPDGTIFIIPAKHEDCEVPERHAKFHWVNLFEKDGYELLFKALRTRASSLDVVINRTT